MDHMVFMRLHVYFFRAGRTIVNVDKNRVRVFVAGSIVATLASCSTVAMTPRLRGVILTNPPGIAGALSFRPSLSFGFSRRHAFSIQR